MGLFFRREEDITNRGATVASTMEQPSQPKKKVPFLAVYLGLVASIGGFQFGYLSGQISGTSRQTSPVLPSLIGTGYFAMQNYAQRFGTLQNGNAYGFSPIRQGTITANLCAGALVGSLIAGKLADTLGRRLTISTSALFCMIGTILEISSTDHWAQFAVGRFIDGLAVGSLSVVVPMYQSECAPTSIRGVLVSSYQLFITLGIWTGYMVDWGTEAMMSSAAWRIPNGLSFLWALILGAGILFLPESPRYAYRMGREDEARHNIARLSGLGLNDKEVTNQIRDIRSKIDEELAGKDAKWYEIFTGPRMFYRTVLGMILMMGQQMTGANFFFYFGTTVFSATGLSNSYVTQIILGSVNVVATFGGLYVAARCGRRKALMAGAAWMFMCFMVYAFVGHLYLSQNKKTGGTILVVFTCLFIVAFATTWGPLVWAIVAELYPARYRAPCMALATADNWLWNFLISFFSTLIVDDIGWLYGLVFGGCCFALFFVVYFFLIETKDRSLEGEYSFASRGISY